MSPPRDVKPAKDHQHHRTKMAPFVDVIESSMFAVGTSRSGNSKQLESLSNKYKDIKQTVTKLREEISDLTAEKLLLQEQNNSLLQQVENLKRLLEAEKKQSQQLEQRVQDLESIIDDLKRKEMKTERLIQLKNEEIEHLTNKCTHLDTQVQNLQRADNQQRRDIEKLQHASTRDRKDIEEMLERCNSLENKLAEYEGREMQLTDTINELEDRLEGQKLGAAEANRQKALALTSLEDYATTGLEILMRKIANGVQQAIITKVLGSYGIGGVLNLTQLQTWITSHPDSDANTKWKHLPAAYRDETFLNTIAHLVGNGNIQVHVYNVDDAAKALKGVQYYPPPIQNAVGQVIIAWQDLSLSSSNTTS